jgi:hypothetical protein
MITLVTQLTTTSIPFWIYPLIFIYIIGVLISAKAVNRRKKWWQKILFVVFWPFFLIAFLVVLAKAF